MSEWEPATDAEAAMRDALRTDDQESYFRILAGVDLLLPVSAEALAGLAPLGWGTWSTGGRTHVLAFTSPSALQACLADYTGSARRVAYAELADTWPNLEWWLAVNPGLPIEGYLPAWFVAQLSRGDVRLPTRGPAREGGKVVQSPQAMQAAARAANAAAAGEVGGPLPAGAAVAASAGHRTAETSTPGGRADRPQSDPGPGTRPAPAGGGSSPGQVGPGGLPIRRPGAVLPNGLPTRTPMAQTPPVPSHLTQPPSGAPASAEPASAEPAASAELAAPTEPAASAAPTSPGGALPRRQAVPPSGRTAPVAAAMQARAGTHPSQAPSTSDIDMPAAPVGPGTPDSERRPSSVPPPGIPPEAPASTPAASTPDAEERPDVESAANAGGTDAPGEAPPPDEDDFVPANAVERDLQSAADGGSTDAFLSTLLLATVLVPVADSSRPGSTPGESGFAFRTEEMDGERFLVVFTSRDRLSEHYSEPARTVGVKFLELIRNWPDPAWSFAVNPGTPIGAKYPGPQVIALASWATDAGLVTDQEDRGENAAPIPDRVRDSAQHATVMQKTVPNEQVDYYLERGYDRVAGFVHRANEVEHLHTPAELFAALGLVHDGSPYIADAKEAFVLRWPAYRPSLYRIPYGGQSEQALRAMDGWVIERAPFRGNGFAPGEGRDVIAEFKVDSVRLPHGAQLWRMDADGSEHIIAIFDSDAPVWRKVGEQ